jgi:Lon protease-like protein
MDEPSDATSTRPPRSLPVVPLFPLPEFFLYPRTVMPLRIFEPRYQQMVEDLLDTSGRLVIGAVVPGHERELLGAPPVHPVAGLGEIVKHEHLPNGHYVIMVMGLQRVRMNEVPSARLYRKVVVEPLVETVVPAEAVDEFRRQLVAAVVARAPGVPLPPDMPLSQLADLLLLHLRMDAATKIELFSRLDVLARARGALEQHARLAPTKPPPMPPPSPPQP